jgi:hypothetical protein
VSRRDATMLIMKPKLISMLMIAGCVALTSSLASAEDRPVDREQPLMMGEGSAPTADILDYQIVGVPGQSGASPTMADQRETGRFIVSKSDSDTWSVNERFSHLGIGEPIAIPGINTSVPQDLWSIEGGAGYNHLLSRGRQFGLNFNIGSDSDHPFYSIHEAVFRVTANYRLPSGDHNAWLFFLNYSNNRHFFNNVPLPGVGYYFLAYDNRLEGLVGFPFASLRYKPTPGWTAQASIFGPRNLNAEISRRLCGPLKAYTAFQWNAQEWLIADRQDYSNRLIFDKKRAALGLRSPLPAGFLVDVSGGRQFDQRFFVNDSSSFSSVPTAGLPPAWFFQTKFTYRFAAI